MKLAESQVRRALWFVRECARHNQIPCFGRCQQSPAAPSIPQTFRYPTLISTANITMQFGAKPLFENVSVKFGGGNRYGLIGANGCGKSTFMKILGGDLEPSGGNVSVEPNKRLGKLRQDQFAFEKFSVIDTVIMGHKELWDVKQERDRIYSLPEMSEEDGMRVADLEGQFAEMDGYTAESRAGDLLLGLEFPIEQHYGPMSEVAPGWKLRVLLAQDRKSTRLTPVT